MPRGSTILDEWKFDDAPRGQSTTFKRGDILFGKLRPYFRKVGVAPIDGRCSTEIVVLEPRQPEFFGFVLQHLASQRFIDHCVAVSTGTRMPRAEWKVAGGYVVQVPPLADLAEFNRLVSTAYGKISALLHQGRTLAAIRDVLLPKLITGELRVPGTADPEEVIGPIADGIAA